MSNNFLVKRRNQFVGSALFMEDKAKIIGQEIVRAREAADMSQADLAKAIGVKSANTINAIEHGKTRKSKYLPDIARALAPYLKVNIVDVNPDVPEGESVIIPVSELTTDRRLLGVYGTAEGGEGIVVLSNEPVQRISMPAPLDGVRDGYGVIVSGDSMSPAIKAGDTILVNPHLPPRRGDLCLFRSEIAGEFQGTIKEYRGQTDEAWKVKRYQPEEKEFSIKKAKWQKCHVIVGTHYRR